MKKLFSFVLGLFMLLVLAAPASAKVVSMEKGTFTVKEGETIDDDLFVGAESVVIDGRVNGNVFVGTGKLEFSGVITGDLVVGAGDVYISGLIGDDLWVGAGQVQIVDTQIGGGANIGAGTVSIDKDTNIDGSLLVGSGNLDNNASIGRNLMAGAGMMKNNAPIAGELRAGAGSINLGSDTKIGGDLIYTVDDGNIVMADDIVVYGETKEHLMPKNVDVRNQQSFGDAQGWAKFGMNIYSILGAMIIGLILIKLFKEPTLAISNTIKDKFIPTLGWGLLIFVVSIPAAILVMFTVIGIPLVFVYLAVFTVSCYLAKIYVSFAFGTYMKEYFKWEKLNSGMTLLVGLLGYFILRSIPFVGGFVKLVVLLSGLGGIWLWAKPKK